MRQRLIDAARRGGALTTGRSGSGSDRARRRRTLVRFGVIAAVLVLVLSVVGPVLAQSGDSRPYTTTDPKSPEGGMIQDLYKLILWMGVVVFVFVQFLIVYTAMRFKRRRSQNTRPNQVHGHRTLEITWTVIPAIVLLIIAVPTISTIYSSYAAADDTDDAIVIEVYGKQWWWEVHYPASQANNASGTEGDVVVTANEIRIPEDQKVVFKLYSNNVIHSFWVPEMTGKMDVIPGHERRISFTPQESGTYYGECAEFCGTAHAWMRFVVKVQPQAEFDSWMAAMQQPPGAATAAYAPGGDVTKVPREVGLCLQCHAIAGIPNAARAGIATDPTSYGAGPNLTLLACRDTLAAGILENTPENLALWLLNPGLVKEGNYMHAVDGGIKNQGEENANGTVLSPDQVNTIVAYLESLRPDAGCPEAGTENGNMNTDAVAANAPSVATPAPATPAATPVGGTPVAATPEATGGAPAAGGPVQLEGIDINWTQKELTVPVGGTIDMWNGGVLPHNFAIEGYNDATPIDLPTTGEHIMWTVPADLAPGAYTFYCEVPGHREAGMVGKITITAA